MKQKVLIVYTGGTIGMINDPKTGHLISFDFKHIYQHVPELERLNIDLTSISFDSPVDSSEMNPTRWAQIATIIETNYDLYDGSLTGIFHCFTGNLEQAKKALSYGGFKLGIGGVLTYKKAGLDEVLKELSLEDFVLETDAPYLPPVPYRGKRNESAYSVHTAEKLAEVMSVSLKEVESLYNICRILPGLS